MNDPAQSDPEEIAPAEGPCTEGTEGEGAPSPSLAALRAQLERTMIADRYTLRRSIARLADLPQPQAAELGKLAAAFARSTARFDARAAALPDLAFDEELPVSRSRDEIAAAIDAHQVVVICGETGSGKTTQLPKICLSLGRGVSGLIGHTQPRRIAARTVAARIASELGTPLGDLVGYQVRFVEQVTDASLVKVMTDGVLLAEFARDRFLNAYDTIIIDEAHERSLNVDFILGYLKRLLPRRPDLKVIVTSATIDPERFSRHFSGAPVIEVSGRTYPVEVRYRPIAEDRDVDVNVAIGDAVREASRTGSSAQRDGDILVFLPGEREIREAATYLRRQGLTRTEILPLYARLNLAQQAHIFERSRERRIVLATNVAETSVTVPNIHFVIDTGVARISRYSYRSKVQGLPVEAVSQASADQRKGRCGRVAPGVCFRLYGESDFEARPAFTEPEIQRTNLAAVILQMKALRLGAVQDFPFIDAPDPRFVKDGYRLLRELGALDANERLTPVGRQLARLPLDPRLGRMLIAAREEGAVAELLTITAALSINDPRERPMDAREAADRAHAGWRDPRSDFMAWLKLWDWFREQARELTRSKLRALCQEHYVNHARLREWADVRRQLKALAAQMGIEAKGEPASYEAVHRALLSGLLTQVGTRHDEGGYRGTRGARFHIFPGSSVKSDGPSWVMAGSLVRTRRLYAHAVARIAPEWIEQLAGDSVSRSYHDARWNARRGQVVASEQVMFLGLQLVSGRRVSFARIDPVLAREVFIREALVAARLRRAPDFVLHNRALIEELEGLEHKLRQGGLAIDEQWQFRFYDARIGPQVCSEKALVRWLKDAAPEVARSLEMSRAELLSGGDAEAAETQFPDTLQVGEHRLPLRFRFEPGHDADGVTATVPVAILNQLAPQAFDWLVPGLRAEKVLAALRSLPKRYRRALVPLPDFARACVESLGTPSGTLTGRLGEELERMVGLKVPDDAWRLEVLAPHLQIRLEVVDTEGVVLGASRDLEWLQAEFGETSSDSFGEMIRGGERIDGRRRWDFGALPERTAWNSAGVDMVGFPALVDQGDGVGVRIMQDAAAANEAHRAGLRRLFAIQGGRDLKKLVRRLPALPSLALLYAAAPLADPHYSTLAPEPDVGPAAELSNDILHLAIDTALFSDVDEMPRDAESFDALASVAMRRIGADMNTVQAALERVVEAYHAFVRVADTVDGPGRVDALSDARTQVARLVHRRFVAVTSAARLAELPRYLAAATTRLRKLDADARADTRRLAEVLIAERPCWARIRRAGHHWRRNPRLVELRWLLEELRISIFAQEQGTAVPVSPKRVQRALEAVDDAR